MDKSLILERVFRREQKLKQARSFRPRLLADQPPTKNLLPALNHARRFVRPLCKGSDQLVEGGLDSVRLDVDEKTMSAGWVISAVNRDRYGDVVVPNGCEDTLDDYRRNPQVFFAHKSNDMPIGLCEKNGKFSFQVSESDIRSRCFFHGSTEESDKVFDLVAKHILRAASIGFLPVYGEIISGEEYHEGDTEIDFDMGGICFQKWSIIEWSVVSVPANAEALRSWLCKSAVKSPSLRRSLEVHATPLRRNQIRSGFQLPGSSILGKSSDKLSKIKAAKSKEFDISKQKLRPASVEIDFASKHIGCEVKKLIQRHVMVPGAKIGGFLCGWQEASQPFQEVDVRSITYDGREMPPVHEVIQLNSTKSKDFLTDGIVFYAQGDTKFTLSVQPIWSGLLLRLYVADKDSDLINGLIDKAWDLASTEYNFLKGEAFSLSGKFIPKTSEKFDDVFLTPTNEKSIKRTLQQLNTKQTSFANRGAIWMGPPGTGKTLSGRVIRNLADATFIWVSAKDFYSYGSFSGFQYAFELAKELSPAILFFEDVDNSLNSYSTDYLKSEMDGIGRSTGIWTILTTNFPEQLPEALIDRPGRFHDVLRFSKPNEAARRTMLEKWLPGFTSEQLDKAVRSTKGYSGAHLYELCHFAKTLREEDESISLAQSFANALEKLAEQREIIKNPSSEPKERAVGKKVIRRFIYSHGRTHSNAQSLLALRNKGLKPVSKTVERNEDETETPQVVEEPENEASTKSCQAVIFSGDHYKTEDECLKWLEENDYSSEYLVPGEEAGDPWISVQFDAECCDVDSVERKDLGDHVVGVYCERMEEEDEEPEHYEDEGNMNTDEGQERGLVADEGRVEAPEAVANEEHMEEDEEEEEDDELPYGAAKLKEADERLEDLHEEILAWIKKLEHEGVKKFFAKMQSAIEKLQKDINAMGVKFYPDDFEEKDEVESEEEEEDLDESKSIIGEAVELLNELLDEKTLKKSQRVACSSCMNALIQISEPKKKKQKKSVTTTSQAEIDAAEAQIAKLADLIYQLTGEEV